MFAEKCGVQFSQIPTKAAFPALNATFLAW
jgi:hypothetical protein